VLFLFLKWGWGLGKQFFKFLYFARGSVRSGVQSWVILGSVDKFRASVSND